MLMPLIFDERAGSLSRRPVALGTRGERHGSLDERPDVRLHRVEVLGQHRLLDLGNEALVGQVDALDLDLGRFLVEEAFELGRAVVTDPLCRVEAGRREDARRPAIGGVAGDLDRALGERLGLVVELGQVDVADGAHPLAARAHAAVVDGVAHDDALALALVDAHRSARLAHRDVEREGSRRSDVGLPEAAEEHPQHGVGIGRRADRRADVGTHPLLVDDDRGRQPVEDVDVGPGERRHEALDEGAVGLVDHPLRLRGDRAEDQRALARAGDAGEHRQPALRDLDADVLEVVHACALHADQVVAVGSVVRGRRGVLLVAVVIVSAVMRCGSGLSSRPSSGARRSSPRRRRSACSSMRTRSATSCRRRASRCPRSPASSTAP